MTAAPTLAERQLEIAVEALRTLTNERTRSSDPSLFSWAQNTLEIIAALAGPAQPDLAEIGGVAYLKALSEHRPPFPARILEVGVIYGPLMAAYAAMLAADEAGRRKVAEDDPRVRELCLRLDNLLRGFNSASDMEAARVALAAFDKESCND